MDKIEELREFLAQRPSLTLAEICREAGVSNRKWYYLLGRGNVPKWNFKFPDDIYRDKILPVMARYGHIAK